MGSGKLCFKEKREKRKGKKRRDKKKPKQKLKNPGTVRSQKARRKLL